MIPPPRIPLATYRLQLHRDFTFAHAAEILPYLHALGISHVYCSPYLKARAGSRHGYDIVDHNALNPEIGTDEDFERFATTLAAHGMGQILDFVPNHMGVGGDDNPWWLDVLEHGQASAYAEYFDIDWRPVKQELRGKVLLPFLEDHYGAVLEGGLLRLEFHPTRGAFDLAYREHRFPIDPRTYPVLLRHRHEALAAALADDRLQADFEALIALLAALPARDERDPERRARRRQDAARCKRRLAELCSTAPAIAAFLAQNVRLYHGTPGDAASFDPLHALLEQQAYRLAYWRVAADEINYRRFFDINTLAGLRMERPEVFASAHRLVLALLAAGKIHGLRLDHPDGLYDPARYYRELAEAGCAAVGATGSLPPVYTVAEKILAAHEHLPEDWPVHGTTGYDFANLVNGLFVHPDGERPLTRLYTRFIGRELDFDELLEECKRLVMRTLMSGELMVLANLLDQLSETDRHTRDYTLHTLRDALMEVVACFPVYRTYITPQRITEQDRRYVDWAVARARRHSRAAEASVFDFIHRVLLLEWPPAGEAVGTREAAAHFVMKFQQYTAPVTAKGLEDTACYVYNRLVSLNEVGGDPRRFGVSIAAFHHANAERAKCWPHSLLCTSTHDSKRSEDVRARLDVLSEIPGEWRRRVARWSRMNRSKKQVVDDEPAPDRNDEYLLYQTLLGTWPLGVLDEAALARFRGRIEDYMLKAAREAKTRTSWINPDPAYEAALTGFVRAVLARPQRNLFMADFLPFQRRIARLGLLTSLSQTLLKLVAPGVPDIYQGTEVWDFSLVDPDNRRPVDYRLRRTLLAQVEALASFHGRELAGRVRLLLENLDDGRAKLYLLWRALGLRRAHPEVFQAGEYLPLAVEGAHAEHLCAFARRHGQSAVVAVAPRWFARLTSDQTPLPLGEAVWADTRIEALTGCRCTNVLTGETPTCLPYHGRSWLAAAAVLKSFPVALLHCVKNGYPL